jgi:hypothetical protein
MKKTEKTFNIDIILMDDGLAPDEPENLKDWDVEIEEDDWTYRIPPNPFYELGDALEEFVDA